MEQSEEIDKSEASKVNKSEGPILRSRQQKRSFHERRPVKRLFTPDIKRHLKSWLIRRRENPYPNREEKAELAIETGLTYIQICNWFANWRRKLKNSDKHANEFTWSHLIKGYNDQALGNVELLSISSDDSIWEEPDVEPSKRYDAVVTTISSTKNKSADHSYSSVQDEPSKVKIQSEQSIDYLHQCFQISSTTDFVTEPGKLGQTEKKCKSTRKTRGVRDKTIKKRTDKKLKVKKPIRDDNWNYRKMRDDFQEDRTRVTCSITGEDAHLLSPCKKKGSFFRPVSRVHLHKKREEIGNFQNNTSSHGKEELDAAEALTFLSRASTTK
ncbi:hypothetical protein RUM43_009114 [Polyplax serrata]|uniref:Homeobox domain-containing protein n=1 Tax=Polyplax serrata TaxID=468196 RepID=A0AAN8NVG7_POLSC